MPTLADSILPSLPSLLSGAAAFGVVAGGFAAGAWATGKAVGTKKIADAEAEAIKVKADADAEAIQTRMTARTKAHEVLTEAKIKARKKIEDADKDSCRKALANANDRIAGLEANERIMLTELADFGARLKSAEDRAEKAGAMMMEAWMAFLGEKGYMAKAPGGDPSFIPAPGQ